MLVIKHRHQLDSAILAANDRLPENQAHRPLILLQEGSIAQEQPDYDLIGFLVADGQAYLYGADDQWYRTNKTSSQIHPVPLDRVHEALSHAQLSIQQQTGKLERLEEALRFLRGSPLDHLLRQSAKQLLRPALLPGLPRVENPPQALLPKYTSLDHLLAYQAGEEEELDPGYALLLQHQQQQPLRAFIDQGEVVGGRLTIPTRLSVMAPADLSSSSSSEEESSSDDDDDEEDDEDDEAEHRNKSGMRPNETKKATNEQTEEKVESEKTGKVEDEDDKGEKQLLEQNDGGTEKGASQKKEGESEEKHKKNNKEPKEAKPGREQKEANPAKEQNEANEPKRQDFESKKKDVESKKKDVGSKKKDVGSKKQAKEQKEQKAKPTKEKNGHRLNSLAPKTKQAGSSKPVDKYTGMKGEQTLRLLSQLRHRKPASSLRRMSSDD